MKSYNHLYEKFISDDNIKLAIKNSSKGKRNRKDIKKIYSNPNKYVDKIKIYAMNFKSSNHNPVTIYDGISRKKRTIIVPDYMEQIVHHMVVNVMIPIFQHGMYEHSYGSIPKRGVHKGKKVVEKWIRNDKKNVKYCLKMDIKKYFDSIPHDVIKSKLKKIIHDERFLKVLFEIIDVTENGLPLGFYTSQWLSNWYLQDLDHYIKEKLYAPHYIRYMDDMVIFGSNKRKLQSTLNEIKKYLENLGLSLNNKYQLFRFVYRRDNKYYGRDLDFMGFRFFRDKTILRKSILFKMTRKAKKISKKDKATIYDMRQMISYLGWIDATNTYNVYLEYIKPFVNFQKLKRKIGNYDRRLTKCGKQLKIVTT